MQPLSCPANNFNLEAVFDRVMVQVYLSYWVNRMLKYGLINKCESMCCNHQFTLGKERIRASVTDICRDTVASPHAAKIRTEVNGFVCPYFARNFIGVGISLP